MRKLPLLLLLMALLVPGLAMVPHGQHVFWVPESVAWLILVPWAALAVWWATRMQDHPPVPSWLKAIFLGVLVSWIVSAAFAVRKDLAALALAEWLGYPLIFFSCWRLGNSRQRRGILLAVLLSYGVLSTAYAAIQAIGGDRVDWAVTFGGRSGAFLGNPNFLGGHLALLFPLSLALALECRGSGKPRRFLAWAVVLWLGAGLLLAQTRGAWVGAAAGTATVLFLAWRNFGGLLFRNRRPLRYLAGLACVGLVGFFLAQPGAWARLTGTFNGQDGEFSRRIFLMKKASQLASLRPLVGVGPGNVRIQFPRVQGQGLPQSEYKSQPYVVGEHAHNDFLQMAAEAGLPAALLWALLMGLVLWQLHFTLANQRNLAREPQEGSLVTLGTLGGLVALLVHGLANFPFLILPTQGAAWALAALALRGSVKIQGPAGTVGLIDEMSLFQDASLDGAGPRVQRISRRAAGALLIMGFIICVANTVYNGRRLSMDRMWWIGQGELQLGHPDQASIWLLRALDLDRREDRLWTLHGRSEVERGLIWNSVGSLREAHRLAPYDPESAVRLARALVENKQYAEAETVLRPISNFAPNFYDLWEPLAAALYWQNKYADAIVAYDWMLYFNINAEDAFVNKAAAQGSLGQLPSALLTLKEAEKRYPDKAKIYVNEAVTFSKLGMRKEAREALKMAERLGPSDPQVDQLKKALR